MSKTVNNDQAAMN